MPDSRDLASQRVKGRMPWVDDEVEIHDLDPALDLDVFAQDDLSAFAPPPKDTKPAPPPYSAPIAPPLPPVVEDDEISVAPPAPPPPVVVTFPRPEANAEMQALMASVRGGTPLARPREAQVQERSEDSRPPVKPPDPGTARASRHSIPL